MLQYLAELDVSYTGITELPNTIINLKSLKLLKMNHNHLQKLPEAIGMMEKLEEIYGEYCARLEMIPSAIMRLPLLKYVTLIGTRVEHVPKLPQSLINVCLSSTAAAKEVSEILDLLNLSSLRNLTLCFAKGDDKSFVYYRSEHQPHVFHSSLRVELPSITDVSSIGGLLRCLGELELIWCKNLRQIQELPSNLRKLTIRNCNLLEVVDLSNLENLLDLSLFNNRICDIQGLEGLASLQCLEVFKCKSSKFRGLERLKNL
ncbi:plant intracellular Ras-group-related LRR protein 4-like [Eucalyptus grandis]|uniref:plant intracellular Ras-group-related LRR protein 4-like n=1 Tax=Eucalyptus grandis TaxID=71139 RepID=UPI00192ED6F8|nr:plant intracellular Ras-group-related LRR protein 4-like [Eucalyptus grandis]